MFTVLKVLVLPGNLPLEVEMTKSQETQAAEHSHSAAEEGLRDLAHEKEIEQVFSLQANGSIQRRAALACFRCF